MNFIAKHLNTVGVLLLTTFVAAAAGMYFNVPARLSKSQTAVPSSGYSCPMHPDVVADRPGDCPKCGMALTSAATQTKIKPTMCQHGDAAGQNAEAASAHVGCNHAAAASAAGGCCSKSVPVTQTPTAGGCTRFMVQPSASASE